MQCKSFRTIVVLFLLVSLRLVGDTVTWKGVTVSGNTSYTNDDVDNSDLWSPQQVPGEGDHAVITYNDTRAIETRFWKPVVIPADADFAPDSLEFNCTAWNGPLALPMYVQKNLTLDHVGFNRGHTSGGNSARVFRIGTSATEGLPGPVTFAAANAATWTGTFTVTGYKGAASYNLANYESAADLRDAINEDTEETGVVASTSGSNVSLTTDIMGSAAFVKVETDAMSDETAIVPTFHTSSVNGEIIRGFDTVPVDLTLSGSQPVFFSGNKGSWFNMWLSADSRLIFSNDDIVFPSFPRASHLVGDGLRGEAGSSVDFVVVGGKVTLSDPGVRTDGSICVDSPVKLRVRSDQVWDNPSGFGFIRMNYSSGVSVLESADDGVLDNLADVALHITFTANNQSYTLPCGSYRGLRFGGSYSSGGSPNRMVLGGPVTLTGYALIYGNNGTGETARPAALSEDYSIMMEVSARSTMVIDMAGHDLSMPGGILFHDPHTGGNNQNENLHMRVDASGATLTVGGDILVSAEREFAGDIYRDLLHENRAMGLTGDADSTFNLGGSFSTMMRSLSTSYNGFSLSQVNLLGGADDEYCTWEVTADPTSEDYGPGSGAIGSMALGSEIAPAYYQLVNEYLNDNDAANIEKVKDGEILLVSRLDLINGVFDLGGNGVKLAALPEPEEEEEEVLPTLTIAAAAFLDLNTGAELEIGDRVEAFMGLGDQVDIWRPTLNQVRDSSNPALGFKPILHSDGNTYWQATAGNATMILIR